MRHTLKIFWPRMSTDKTKKKVYQAAQTAIDTRGYLCKQRMNLVEFKVFVFSDNKLSFGHGLRNR